MRVLFFCTGNSGRSQMAEGLLRALGNGAVASFSAGTEPTNVHPLAIEAMRAVGIDISAHRSKHFDGFLHQKFDFVITVCDRAKDACPNWPGVKENIHWSFEDPARFTDVDESRRAFVEVRNGLTQRIRLFLLAHGVHAASARASAGLAQS